MKSLGGPYNSGVKASLTKNCSKIFFELKSRVLQPEPPKARKTDFPPKQLKLFLHF